MFHLQIQEPASRSTPKRPFVILANFFLNFIISKYLKQKANLSICVDERSPCGLSTGDIKIYQSQMIKSYCYYLQCRSSPWTSIKELFLLTKFDNSSPLCNLGQRDLSKSHDYELMMSLPPDMEHPMELFECGLPAVQV